MALRRPSAAFWRGKRVFLTGHTGFKGGWLTLWLHELGAVTSGYALAPETTPNLFTACQVAEVLEHHIGDIRDHEALCAAVAAFQPEIIFHLAAQPLVRASYRQPVETFATNILGTANLLDAAAKMQSVTTVLIITSDKVYAESATSRHVEAARLGGHDPYSASKACAELVTAAFPMRTDQNIATLRSGNVIGGGDWAEDRLLPDFFRAMSARETLNIRNPGAVRPWQHVLDPLCGYLLAAESLHATTPPVRETWNFGPDTKSEIPVIQLAEKLCLLWGDAAYHVETAAADLHEASALRLNADKARRELHWQPGLTLDEALAATVDWFKNCQAGVDMSAFTKSQIKAYGA